MKSGALRRMLSILLCLSLLLSFMPTAALAADVPADADLTTDADAQEEPQVPSDEELLDTSEEPILEEPQQEEPTPEQPQQEEPAEEDTGFTPLADTQPVHAELPEYVYTLVEGFEGWSGDAALSVPDGTVTFNTAGNHILAYGDELAADKFLISFDMTPNMAADSSADLRVEFKADGTGATDNRLQARFSFKSGTMVLERTSQTNNNNQAWGGQNNADTAKRFDWEQGHTYGVDILVDSAANTVIIYFNGGDGWTVNNVPFSDVTGNHLAIACQFANQNVTVSNLTVTTCEDPNQGGDDVQPGEGHLPALRYVLINGGLGDESKWTKATSSNGGGSFVFDKEIDSVAITGTGLNNAITYNGGKIPTENFLIQFNIKTPANKTDADDFKVRMKEDPSTGNRLQLHINFKSSILGLEGVNNTEAGGTVWGGTGGASEHKADFEWTPGETYPVDILVQGDTVTIYWNGEKLLEKPHGDVAAMVSSALSFASQYGNQNHTLSNLLVTSDDDPNAAPAKVATPVIADDNGIVTIACETPDAAIYYTINGSAPTTGSTLYTGPFTLEDIATVKAIAVKAGMEDSAVASRYIVVVTQARHALQPFTGEDSRVLLPSTALDSPDAWSISLANASSSITIANGKAHLVVGGANNRMGYSVSRINADKFLIQFDYTPNAGNTNSNFKVAFKCTDQYEGDRLQVRFNNVAGDGQVPLSIERATASSTTWSKAGSFSWVLGKTYGVDILVDGNTITVYLDGQNALSYTHADIGKMTKGWFAFSTQFPTGDVTVENLLITTDEVRTGQLYTVTLETNTDGVTDATPGASGNLLTADTLTGYSGDLIQLAVDPAHGYVFDRFTSYMTDNGNSTDGLVPISNNAFVLNEKFGNLTVVAHFVRRTPGRFELFQDDFAADGLDSAYNVQAPEFVRQEGRVVTVDAPTGGNNYLLLPQNTFASVRDNEGHRVSVDAWKANSTNGTMQIMFKGASFDDRYVLVLNGDSALFRHITATSNDQLAKTAYAFSTKPVNLVVEVIGDTATFYANGSQILRYTSPDNWGGAPNAAGIINMTSGAPVCFDNLLVERIPVTVNLGLEAHVMIDGDEAVDSNHTAGIFSASAYNAVEGDRIVLTATPKTGYELREFYVVDHPEIVIDDGVLTIPADLSGSITVVAVFQPAGLRAARSFYIDSVNGDDSGDGSIDQPWRTLGKLAAYTESDPLVPGDQVLLRRGSVFNSEQLRFSGMGSAQAPVVISAYGEGSALPRLNGNGVIENVVSLFNQEYVTISNLEITNTSPRYNSAFTLNNSNNTSLALRAINVSAKDFGVVSGIKILNCYIHDVNGNINLKWNGGIFFDVQADIVNGALVGIPTKYDDVLIEGCTFINVDRSGIKLVSSSWCNQWAPNSPGTPVNWYPSTNVVIRNNYMEYIGGDGITTRDTDGALIEYNLVKDARYQDTGYNVGIWPFQAANTVIQYNEAYNTHSTTDGQGLDCDHASAYSLMQYNYSHNNEGGFMLIMGGYPHTAATVRYNISQNDYDKTFEFAQGIPMGTMIYNNTLYSAKGASRGILYLSNTANGRGINDVYLFNNLFIYPAGQSIYGGDSSKAKLIDCAHFYNNAYVGGVTAPAAEANAITVADIDAVLVNAGSAPESNGGFSPIVGGSGTLDGYQLVADCELIDKGVTIAQAIEHFGGAGFQVFDGRDLAPSVLEALYYGKSESSLKYVMGENFPQVPGVRYDLDFFGNTNRDGAAPDIGAAEFLQHEHSYTAEVISPTCTEGGYTVYSCTLCTHSYQGDETEAAHSPEVIPAVPATYTSTGLTEGSRCSVCGEILTAQEVTPMLVYVPPVEPVQPEQPDDPGTEIPDPDTPLVEQPDDPTDPGTSGEDIDDPDTPLTEQPEDPADPGTPGEDIDDPDTPLADQPGEDSGNANVPQTGDSLYLWLAIAVLSGTGLLGLISADKKRKA